jgi:hypothetical protein
MGAQHQIWEHSMQADVYLRAALATALTTALAAPLVSADEDEGTFDPGAAYEEMLKEESGANGGAYEIIDPPGTTGHGIADRGVQGGPAEIRDAIGGDELRDFDCNPVDGRTDDLIKITGFEIRDEEEEG